jgi:hypothetical protein
MAKVMEKIMIAINQLINEIETLPNDNYIEIMDFIGYLKTKNKKIISETMLLYEKALEKEWDTPEEDEAWDYL